MQQQPGPAAAPRPPHSQHGGGHDAEAVGGPEACAVPADSYPLGQDFEESPERSAAQVAAAAAEEALALAPAPLEEPTYDDPDELRWAALAEMGEETIDLALGLDEELPSGVAEAIRQLGDRSRSGVDEPLKCRLVESQALAKNSEKICLKSIHDMSGLLAEQEAKVRDLQARLAESEQWVEAARAEVARERGAREMLEDSLSSSEGAYVALLDENRALKTEVEGLRAHITHLEARPYELQEAGTPALELKGAGREQLEVQLEERARDLEQSHQAAEAESDDLKTRLADLRLEAQAQAGAQAELEAKALQRDVRELRDADAEVETFRREALSLGDAVQVVEQLRAEVRELSRAAGEAEGLREQVRGLIGVAKEVEHLRREVEQLAGCAQENESLRLRLEELGGAVSVREDPEKALLRKELWGLRERHTALQAEQDRAWSGKGAPSPRPRIGAAKARSLHESASPRRCVGSPPLLSSAMRASKPKAR